MTELFYRSYFIGAILSELFYRSYFIGAILWVAHFAEPSTVLAETRNPKRFFKEWKQPNFVAIIDQEHASTF
jgi:hypothetical protein